MKIIKVVLISFLFCNYSFAQSKFSERLIEYSTWALIQAVPSPSFYQDNNNDNSRFQFGLKWNITPVNISFNANELVSPVQFFKINPVRRYGGSLELFIQPEWATAQFQYADLNRFMLTGGTRLYIPVIEDGEYLSASVGTKYTQRKSISGEDKGTFGIEAGGYILFGMLGFQLNYNFSTESRYSMSFNLKYY